MAPLHHHFELAGWPETTVIIRFWILAGMCTALAIGVFYADFLEPPACAIDVMRTRLVIGLGVDRRAVAGRRWPRTGATSSSSRTGPPAAP